MSATSKPGELIPRSREAFHKLSNRLLATADKGRLTLDLLKDLSFSLLDFAQCEAVEIAYTERTNVFHCDTRRTEQPRFVCATTREEPGDGRALLTGLSLEKRSPRAFAALTETFDAPERLPANLVASHDAGAGSVVSLLIPGGERLRGVALLSFAHSTRLGDEQAEQLASIARSLGMALAHNQNQFDLRERVKELTCMYGIAHAAAGADEKLEKLLERIVHLLPPAMLYPEITEACIELDERRTATDGFAMAGLVLATEIVVDGEKRGTVKVAYRESRPELDEGPFLSEERKLLDSVAREVALIVERRRAQNEQKRLKEQLHHAERLATIGKLAAGVAHELNEPLTGILGFAELLKDIDAMPEQAVADIARIESSALHAREIVRKLLLFARQVPTRRREVAVNAVIAETIAFFSTRFSKGGIGVQTELAADLPSIVADEAQVRQILVNLLVNASQAMPRGGKLTLRTRHEGAVVVLTVRDTGLGMTHDVAEKAFLPFFTTKDVDQGTGLGLSVVHGIIEAHGGTIALNSTPGAGTTFTITLPIGQATR